MPNLKLGAIIGERDLGYNDVQEVPEIPSSVFIGVEVELEHGEGLKRKRWGHWRMVPEPSLRQEGVELVFNKPKAGRDALEAIEELGTKMTAEAEGTSYCSTHVHLNFLNRTRKEIMNFIYVYLLFEETLVKYAGGTREGNAFALSSAYAEGILETYRDMQKAKNMNQLVRAIIRAGGQGGLKYAALNLGSLTEYGTIESRMMRGLKRKNDILVWVNILLRIYEYSLTIQNVGELLGIVSGVGIQGFVQEVLGDHAVHLEEHLRTEEVYEAIDRIQYIVS